MDKFEQRLEQSTLKLRNCQTEKGFVEQHGEAKYSTCTQCPELFECKIRLEYIKAVYSSMSREKSGGFEF